MLNQKQTCWWSTVIAAIVLISLSCSSSGGQGTTISGQRMVFVRGQELYLAKPDGTDLTQLTNDKTPKQFPRWSGDGKSIAYVIPNNPKTAKRIATVVITTDTGKRLTEIPIRPETPVQVVGLRFVTQLEWVTNNTIGIEGSVNPSTDEYVTIDVSTGQELQDYFGSDFTWSPDRKMLAFRGLVPHLVPEESKSDYLQINNETVYPVASDRNLHRFVTNFAWSADSTKLAFVEEDPKTHILNLIITNRKTVELRLPASVLQTSTIKRLAWFSGTLLLLADGAIWKLNPQARQIEVADQKTAQSWRSRQYDESQREQVIRKLGGSQPDFRDSSENRK